ncbi:hypothetical protein CLU81_0535 [Flavobacterium sp. 9]|uniref:hypothetical protein n=1 Tax=Flavobacterium sp. 9 TaxID=2035198 RepID=UPI000C182CD4|nr:hypothetical protein [Flavobacterium sp. 9]PIF30132.1 hypothetical protein CLU81_0535 [Flavobacterium sp. 9]
MKEIKSLPNHSQGKNKQEKTIPPQSKKTHLKLFLWLLVLFIIGFIILSLFILKKIGGFLMTIG